MNKKVPIGVTISLMILASALTFSITMIFAFRGMASSFSTSLGDRSMGQKLNEIDHIIQENYIDTVDPELLADGIAAGYMAGIDDQYAEYYSKEEYDKQKQDTQGKGIGVGLNITQNEEGYFYVVSVIPGTPAEESGMRSGDVIIRVGDDDVAKLGYAQAYEALLGEVGSHCIFTILRDGKEIEMDIVRREYESISINHRMIGEIGYIRITGFHDNTPEQFEEALTDLQNQNAKGLIFDLRNNGGGTLDSVAEMLDALLPEGDIVSATYKGDRTEVLYTSDADEIDLPMDVLINNGTASASELFAAAVKDYNKGNLIGEKSYGKGVMQRTYELEDGSAVKVTIARFQPPSGENFDGEGLQPDIKVEFTEKQKEQFYKMTDKEDIQLQAALEDLD